MPQIKEDKFIAEAYENIVEIAPAYNPEESPEIINNVKNAIFTIANGLTKGGKTLFKTLDGQTYTLDRIFIMLDEAKTKEELRQIYNALGLDKMKL